MAIYKFKEAAVYKMTFALSMGIFQLSRFFAKEEKYSLTDQVRRSSRSVCTNLAEAYRKKRYPAHFISKLTDCVAKNSETGVWLEFAFACEYINAQTIISLNANQEIGRLLNHIINNPDKY
ncbi:MAG TPA: four helix bundle protein [Chitinophagales bacterium]|nr:four helix bundle protein [Chitinophagales bacterium]